MDSITVKVDDLLAMVKDIKSENMKYVKLELFEADKENDIPPSIGFYATESIESPALVDFGEVDATTDISL